MAFSRILIVGYGSIGQGLTPLLLRHFPSLQPGQVNIVTADEQGSAIARAYGIALHVCPLTEQNYRTVLSGFLSAGDVLINVSVRVSSIDLIQWCQSNDVLYLDTCIEPWPGGYDGALRPVAHTTNCWLREQALELRANGRATALVAHGANPGLVSHFVKQGLLELARQKGVSNARPFAEIAQALGIRSIHVAERDTQDDGLPLAEGEFASTWSPDGLMSEAYQHAEIGWGTHELTPPANAAAHGLGGRCGVFLDARSATVKVKSWVPSAGRQTAYLITHHEVLSIADFLSVYDSNGSLSYRPTVFYAYHPSEKTCASLENWAAMDFAMPRCKTLMRDAVRDGYDELGALLVFDGGAYWYGSTLAHARAVELAPCNNATSLQVASGVIGVLQWMLDHPREGVVEAEDLAHDAVLSVAMPYLGLVYGVETDWQPSGKGRLQFADFLETRN